MTLQVPPALALFDLDHTLLDADSNEEWLDFLLQRRAIDVSARARQAAFFADYHAGQLDMGAYLGFQASLLLGRDAGELRALRDAYAHERLAPRIPAASHALLQHHRDAGHLIAIVSATHSFLAEASATLLGVEHLVATRLETSNGIFTGKVLRPWSFREGKLDCVARWLEQLGFQLTDFGVTYFYSDSSNDLPLLEAVTHPVAVNADPGLAQLAHSRGWRCLSLRCGSAETGSETAH